MKALLVNCHSVRRWQRRPEFLIIASLFLFSRCLYLPVEVFTKVTNGSINQGHEWFSDELNLDRQCQQFLPAQGCWRKDIGLMRIEKPCRLCAVFKCPSLYPDVSLFFFSFFRKASASAHRLVSSGFRKRLFVPWHLHSWHFKTSSPSWHWDVRKVAMAIL